ncbi:hypothetical protein AJ78_03092 [Emergomyces pasteurianus Ep9510]|uniref:Nickel/cobalt efflux system n=1 Tax=Emergomyces pasteurianus Ep9510 TaxID=1447872 RepID=A0A1J9PLJ6_9EURO|nr:hypothetical protein AJ78_03092 [Emergomyces pasteurianus Ep9510]
MTEPVAAPSKNVIPSSILSPPHPIESQEETEHRYEFGYYETELEPEPAEDDDNVKSLKRSLLRKAQKSHNRVPGLRKIPLPALGIIFLIAAVNIVVWVAAAIVLRFHPSLVSTAVLSYTLGLRHALDADHISAIDLMTRRLLATGQKAVTVGTFFSLGHSTIVIVTSIVVAATAAAVSSKFDRYSRVGGIIGSSVSSAFLILLGIMNAYILYKLVQQMKKVLHLKPGEEDKMWKIEGGGVLFRVLKKMFKLIDRPWKMYPLGVLFGLGFDTSSEIALLGISSIQAARGTSIWVILIFPILFTAGMCLIDTIDGALMLSLYIQPAQNFLPAKSSDSSITTLSTATSPMEQRQHTSGSTVTNPSRNPRDPIAFLYYSIVLTSLTVIVAVVIGVLQLLTMILNVTEAKGRFWDGVETAGEYYDVIGGSICGCFILFGGLSVLVYPYWRRWVARRKAELPDDGVEGILEEGRRDGAGGETGYGSVETFSTAPGPSATQGGRLKEDSGNGNKGGMAGVSAEEQRLS